MLKCITLVVLFAAGVSANEWWDPLGLASGNHNQPILAKLTPAMKSSVPKNIQMSMAKVTPKDILGLRAMAERLTKQPTSRAQFLKLLQTQAPNVMHLSTEAFKVGRDNYAQTRKRLSTDAVKFMKSVAAETSNAVNEASALFNKQDAATKKNIQSVFPFIPELIKSSKNSIQYVSKNI